MSFKSLFICGYWDTIVVDSLKDLKCGNVIKIKASLFEWYADPFILTLNNKKIVLCERKKISKNNGDICVFSLEKKLQKNRVISEKYHLSFPNIFQIKNELFIIPESSRGNMLRLYKYNHLNNSVSLFKVLKENCSLVDTIVKQDGNNTFLFSYDTNNVLIQYALNDDYSLSEVDRFVDYDHTLRPAGNPHNGVFFFQDCSKIYGEKIVSKMLLPNKGFQNCSSEYLDSISIYCKKNHYLRYHTINFDLNSDSIVFDVYREKVNLLKPLLILWRKIRGNA